MAKIDKTSAVKVRVLTVCEHGQVNEVVTLDPGIAADAIAAGLVDASPEAVAYAETIAG